MEWWNNLNILTRIALICFIVGKINFVPAVLTVFAAYEYSLFLQNKNTLATPTFGMIVS